MKNKELKKNKKIDWVVILALLIGILLFALFNSGSDSAESFVASAFMLFFQGLMVCLPIIMIYLAIRLAFKRNEKKNMRFEVVDNIDYYRDNLGELSPGLISLMADLDIEDDKDITAMILHLKSKNIINIQENNSIIINKNYDNSSLMVSDLVFLDWIRTRQHQELQTWKRLIEKEAYQAGYIQPKDKGITGCLFPILIELVIVILLVILGSLIFGFNGSNLFWLIFELILFVILFITMFYFPIFKFVYFITSNLSQAKVKRTKLGNQLTEKIYAMKNFIHDFGNLSEATKEHLVLWDYFLIYAVILEENEEIVNEISRCRNVNIHQFRIDKLN